MPSDNEAVVPRNSSAYYPPPDEIDPYSPINLNVLRDAPGGGKPLYSYSTLIRYAIKGSPEGRLLLEEIYYAIEQRFPWFKTAPPGWKNSIRHNLSLNACFEKVPRPLTDRGKGSYWTVNDSIDPKQGIHRVRRRRKAGKATTPTPTYQPAFPGYATGAADGTGFDPYAMYPYGYDASMYPPPFFPPGSGPDMTGNTVSGFEGSAEMGLGEGSATVVDWRAAFFGELERLKSMTKEQDKQGAPAEWYRMMLHRLRIGMWGIPALGTPMVAGAEGQSSEQAGGGLDDDGEDEDE